MPVPPVEEWGDDGGLMLDDAVLDEEALRDMVSEIVRQELQGALGERITRNVRKLVRREIHRALTSQDMD
jgi:cell pole-organizing protein PopZ